MDSLILKNAPLKEVIFELHWNLDYVPQQNSYIDSGFDSAVLKFKDACQPEFKEFEILTPGISYNLLNNRVTHRFLKETGKHPVYQIGPGVFTVNDNNKNYSWPEFQQLISNGIGYLKNSYAKDLSISTVQLIYIDAVNCAIFGDANKFDFLKNHLQVNAESYPFVEGKLEDINFSKRFSVAENAYLNVTVATARDKNTDDDIIVWHTFISNKENLSWDSLEQWLHSAHAVCSETFKKMTSQHLYEYFSR